MTTPIMDLPPYPPNTPGFSSSGYIHNLNGVHSAAIKVLEKWFEDNHVDFGTLGHFFLHPRLTILRYLRAKNFDTNAAITHIRTNIEWRKEKGVDELIWMNPDEIIGCPMRNLMEIFPHWQCGYDKTGRPVLYKQYANFDCGKINALVGFDRLTLYHLWEQEHCMKLCMRQSDKTGCLVETTTVVMDLDGMKMSQVSQEFMAFVKSVLQVDQSQYPETLGRLFIINTPSVFPFVWRIIKPFLDPNTAAKISILSTKKEWSKALLDCIGEENMPSTYGGKLPPLSKNKHPYEECMQNLQFMLSKNDGTEVTEEVEQLGTSDGILEAGPDSDENGHSARAISPVERRRSGTGQRLSIGGPSAGPSLGFSGQRRSLGGGAVARLSVGAIRRSSFGVLKDGDGIVLTGDQVDDNVSFHSDHLQNFSGSIIGDNIQILFLNIIYYMWIFLCAISLKSVAQRLAENEDAHNDYNEGDQDDNSRGSFDSRGSDLQGSFNETNSDDGSQCSAGSQVSWGSGSFSGSGSISTDEGFED